LQQIEIIQPILNRPLRRAIGLLDEGPSGGYADEDEAATAAGALLVVLRNDPTAEILEMGTTV
jgi:hypothetical protein